MDYTVGTCPNCKQNLSVPTSSEYACCPLCNTTFRVADSTAAAAAAPAPVPSPYAGTYNGAYGAPAQHQTPAANNLLATWKTDIVASILGLVAGYAFSFILNAVMELTSAANSLGVLGALSLVSLAFVAVSFFYALSVYPSLFSDKPRITSPRLVAFLNLLFGGIIFGCIWNSNLTNRNKGVSHIVFVGLSVGLGVLYAMLGFAAGM